MTPSYTVHGWPALNSVMAGKSAQKMFPLCFSSSNGYNSLMVIIQTT